MNRTLRVALLLPFACAAIAVFSTLAQGQKFDVAIGFSTIDAPGASKTTGDHQPQSLSGGGYPMVSGDFMFLKDRHVGIEAEVSWKLSDGIYLNGYQNVNSPPFRPLFADVNAIWTRKVWRRISAEAVGGGGLQTTRFYGEHGDFASSNHFMLDGGGGLRFNVWRRFFLRPEVRAYYVPNNVEFSSGHMFRWGASLGYTFK